MANNVADDEIIEKQESTPIATACLILAAVGLLGAMIFQWREISEVRAKMITPGERTAQKAHEVYEKLIKNQAKDAVAKILADHDHPEIGKAADDTEAPPEEKAEPEGDADTKAAPAGEPAPEADAKAEAAKPDETTGDAKGDADEARADKQEAPAEEPAADEADKDTK